MVMKILRYIELALAGIMLSVSCTDDRESGADVVDSEIVPAVLDATINDMERPETRRTVDNYTDYWTTRTFSEGDKIGVFSTGGLVGPNGESKWMKNEYMDYYQATGSSNYRFRNDALIINTGMMGGKVGKYVYFPYTEEMPVPKIDGNESRPSDGSYIYYHANPNSNTTLDAYFQDKKGLLLRRTNADDKSIPEGLVRCIDYMFINNISLTNGSLGGGFYHGFSEIIILRGNGFDKVPEKYEGQPENEIWAHMTAAYTRLTLSLLLQHSTGNYEWRSRLWYVADDEPDQEKAKKWQAWKGEKYIDSDEKGRPVPRDAWYVIVPSSTYSSTTLDYIEVYNNDGERCMVTNMELYYNASTGAYDKNMRYGNRYAIELMMTEHGATARPVEISEWYEGVDGSNDITDIRTVGIKNDSDLQDWATAYNTFIADGENRPDSREDLEDESSTYKHKKLSQYGDYDFDKGKWLFYITDNIKLPTGANIGVTKLNDVLKGMSKITNYTISNLKNTFITEIAEKGELQNLDFDNLYVKPGSYTTDNTAGALTNRLNRGKIENCNINNGTIIGSAGKTIGMLCGTVEGGSTVKDCTASGAVIGMASDGDGSYPEGLFGKVNGGLNAESGGYNADDLIIRPL